MLLLYINTFQTQRIREHKQLSFLEFNIIVPSYNIALFVCKQWWNILLTLPETCFYSFRKIQQGHSIGL